MNIIRYIICFLLIQSHGLFSQDYSSIRKKTRLAIFSILDKTNQNYSDGSELNLDKRLYDKLESELVKSEKFILVDRNKIESIMQEQSIQQTGIISDQSATTLGKLLGVQLAIFGSLNDIFQESDWVTNEGKVSLDAGLKIIDIKTGEIVLAENELVSVVLSQNPGDEFSRSGVSNVVLKTAEIFTQKILLEGNKIPWEARITNVLPGGKVVLNAGMADGIKIGLVFHIYSLGDEIVDPSTGLSFGFVESYSGEIIVLKNDLGGGKASLCEVTASETTINNSDVVKIPENVAVPIYRFYHKKNKVFYTPLAFQGNTRLKKISKTSYDVVFNGTLDRSRRLTAKTHRRDIILGLLEKGLSVINYNGRADKKYEHELLNDLKKYKNFKVVNKFGKPHHYNAGIFSLHLPFHELGSIEQIHSNWGMNRKELEDTNWLLNWDTFRCIGAKANIITFDCPEVRKIGLNESNCNFYKNDPENIEGIVNEVSNIVKGKNIKQIDKETWEKNTYLMRWNFILNQITKFKDVSKLNG